MSKIKFNENAVLDALRQKFNLKRGRLKVYEGWKSEEWQRARATFTQASGPDVSYFLHISPKKLNIWEDNSNKPTPNHTLEGEFISS